MSPGITKRSVMIAGHRTSVSLEDPFWAANHTARGHDRGERVDLAARRLVLRDGPPLAWDKLLLALGSVCLNRRKFPILRM